MTNSKILTIGIPTYNGALRIRETIDSIAPQLGPDCEILVSDNASSDKTQEVVLELSQKYPGLISYHRNRENRGFDGNLNAIFDRALGRYVWLFGDDDILSAGAVAAVRPLLEKDLDYIFVNYSHCEHDLSLRQIRSAWFQSPSIPVNISSVIALVGTDICFMSAHIFKRSAWSQDAEHFIGKGYLHVEKCLSLAALPNARAWALSQPLVLRREGTSANALGWQKDQEFVVLMHSRVLAIAAFYRNSLSLRAFSRLKNSAARFFLFQVYQARRRGCVFSDERKSEIEKNLFSFPRLMNSYEKIMRSPAWTATLVFWAHKSLWRLGVLIQILRYGDRRDILETLKTLLMRLRVARAS